MEPKIGSGSSGSVFIAGSAGSGSKTVRFPVPGSVPTLPEEAFKTWDADGNGSISRQELATVFWKLNRGGYRPPGHPN